MFGRNCRSSQLKSQKATVKFRGADGERDLDGVDLQAGRLRVG